MFTIRHAVRRALGVAVAFAALCAVPTAADAALTALGPVDATGFPTWFQDGTGLQLQQCTGASCAPLPGHIFYWTGNGNLPGGGQLIMAVQGAFLTPTGDPAVGAEVAMGRIRIRVPGLHPNTAYTVTHPYGVDKTTTSAKGAINDTIDIGCLAPPCTGAFGAVLGTAIGPYLRWDPRVAPQAPAGFLGDAVSPHAVVGSPLGTNYFEVAGPDAGGAGVNVLRTDQLIVSGQVLGTTTPLASVATPPDFGEHALGERSQQSIVVNNDSTVGMSVTGATLAGTHAADYTVTGGTCATGVVAASGSCTVDVAFGPTAVGGRFAKLAVGTPVGSPTTVALAGTGAVPAPPVAVATRVPAALRRLRVPRSMPLVVERFVGLPVSFQAVGDARRALLQLRRLGAGGRIVARASIAVNAPGPVNTTLRGRAITAGRYVLTIRLSELVTGAGAKVAATRTVTIG